MDLQSPVAAKKLWNLLKLAIFMMRKGLIAKRKLIMDMKLIMERGKVLGKSLGNLMFHHHHHHHPRSSLPQGPDFGLHAYEFSCSNSPNPIFYGASAKRRHNLFSCINASVVEEPDEMAGPVVVLPRIGYSPQCAYSPNVLAVGEQRSPMLSPFSVRVSNYSSEDEADGFGREVDDKAEEFIRRFYEQLRAQSRVALLQFDEK